MYICESLEYDIYINISGGFKVDDPALDMPVCLAVASAIKDKPIPHENVYFGEVGLLGEVKPVSHKDARLAQIKKRGFTAAKRG